MRTALDLLDAAERDHGAVLDAAMLLLDDYQLSEDQESAAERELRRHGWKGDRFHGLSDQTGHTHLSLEEAVYVDAFEGRYRARGRLLHLGIDRRDEFTFVCSNPQEAEGLLRFGDNEHQISVADIHYWLKEGAVVLVDPG